MYNKHLTTHAVH